MSGDQSSAEKESYPAVRKTDFGLRTMNLPRSQKISRDNADSQNNEESPLRGGYFLEILPEIRLGLLPVFSPPGFEILF